MYRYTDAFGKEKQRWEPVKNNTAANKRKAEIENEQYQGTFITPDGIRMEEFLEKYIALYGRKKWGATTMGKNKQLIKNYIKPILGNVRIQDITTDPKLSIAINLSFACTLRIGEILRLQRSNVFISDEDILKDNAHVIIDKQLQRESIEDLEELNYKDIIFVFPHVVPRKHTTALTLKSTKSNSDRKVWIPRTLAQLLREWKENQEEMKELLGKEYTDYDFVVCLENGRPCSTETISTAWRKLREKHGISKNVVFHSFRHSSNTQKLKLNHGYI